MDKLKKKMSADALRMAGNILNEQARQLAKIIGWTDDIDRIIWLASELRKTAGEVRDE